MSRLVVCLMILVVTFFVVARAISSQETASQRGLGEGTIQWHAQRAKQRGQQEIIIPAPRWRPVGVSSLEEALGYFTVVVATPIENKSYIRSSNNIRTWYKFKVHEFLSRKNWAGCPTCPPPPDVPSEMLPLAEDEVLVPRGSGTVIVDGVKITSLETDYPLFSESHQYLLFLKFDASKQVGEITLGHAGVFTVSPSGGIKQINRRNHRFAHEIASDDVVNALNLLKGKIAQFQKQQVPR
ncbi:MAG: hypothetical protein LC775_00250 [Acidobacteria bacterium]|nr:hypothetical protein [Acidobacteriota bacterium]